HPQRELGYGGIRLPTQRRETTAQGALNARRIEAHHPAVALDDGRGQSNFFDFRAIDDAQASLCEAEVQLSSGRYSVETIGAMYGVSIRSEHACTFPLF